MSQSRKFYLDNRIATRSGCTKTAAVKMTVGFLVMWVSGLTKSPVLAVAIPSLLILLPEYLWNFYSPTMRRIIGLLPDKLLDMETAIQYLYPYTFGNYVYSAIPIIVTVYPCLTAALALLCYRAYQRKQIA